MSSLFFDKELLKPVNIDVLFEGVVYYLNVETYSKVMIDQWLLEEYILNSIVSYHPKNKILIIRFDNIVGYVNILGTIYDIRSKKLLDSYSGNEQFQRLLDEVNEISNKLTFNFKGSSYSQRKTTYEYNFNILEIFDYYYQLVFTFPAFKNLEALLNQCFKHPHTANRENVTIKELSKSKRISTDFYKQLGSTASWKEISTKHVLANSAIARRTLQKSERQLLPLIVSNSEFISTTNTTENRFLKFFLEDIQAICLRIASADFDIDIKNKAAKLQRKIHNYLQYSFFKSLSPLHFVPSSSSVLLKKSGYREIYFHFVQSKFSFRPILEDMRHQAHRAGLKNIAALYEIWVFFKMAVIIFENETIQETFNGRVLKNGSMIGAYTWKGNHFQLSYNQSYTQNNKGSYSVILRPDISLKIDDRLYLFDAKYKYTIKSDEEDDLKRVVKQEDIHKMHAYLDAIPKAETAIVLYPGTDYIFYERALGTQNRMINLDLFKGVGAIPLSPKNSEMLSIFFENLK